MPKGYSQEIRRTDLDLVIWSGLISGFRNMKCSNGKKSMK